MLTSLSKVSAAVTWCCRDSGITAKLSAIPHSRNMSVTSDSILQQGPYVCSTVQSHVTTVRPTGQQQEMRPVRLPVIVTVPMTSSPSSTAPAGPYPVCLLLNGFQARASYYAPLARRLASWGMVVLQYNAPALTIIPDAVELPFLTPVVDWLKTASTSNTHPALQGRADMNRLVIAGHSRGGKLAGLHYSSGSVAGVPIKAAFLIDPVDNTAYTPESAAYPSATRALRAACKPFGMAAAGVMGPSNPAGSNWHAFDAAAGPGSWLLKLKQAGHTTFMKPPTRVEAWLLDRMFGGGPLNRDVAVSQTAAAMLAWFGQQLSQPAAVAAAGTAKQTGPHATVGANLLRHITAAAVHVPVASAGLQAAAVAAAHPAAAEATAEQVEDNTSLGRLAAAFQEWVTSPVAADQVEFKVKK